MHKLISTNGYTQKQVLGAFGCYGQTTLNVNKKYKMSAHEFMTQHNIRIITPQALKWLKENTDLILTNLNYDGDGNVRTLFRSDGMLCIVQDPDKG